jgi:glycine/serine hydroxymethyltransferase
MKEKEMEQIGTAINLILSHPGDQGKLEEARRIVDKTCADFPIY